MQNQTQLRWWGGGGNVPSGSKTPRSESIACAQDKMFNLGVIDCLLPGNIILRS